MQLALLYNQNLTIVGGQEKILTKMPNHSKCYCKPE